MPLLMNVEQKSINMKYLICIQLLFFAFFANAQSKNTRQVLSNTYLLEQTVFGTKDSTTLDNLFAKSLVYQHSSGRVESREQAIQGIMQNKSMYDKMANLPTATEVFERGDSLVTKKVFSATEKKPDGSTSLLNLTIEMVWIKENKNWKLARRNAIKNQ
jgi:ketosteroid isomerase-like protein